ncbi:hypothetical protein SHIRM173S_11759 [Streptomyces hirsutus]
MTIGVTVDSGPDRTAALADGRVRVPGVDLTWLPLGAEEIYFRMARHGEFSASERFGGVVHGDAGAGPAVRGDPGVPLAHLPAPRGVRPRRRRIHPPRAGQGEDRRRPRIRDDGRGVDAGIFDEHYGLPVDSVSYRTGGLLEPGRTEKLAIHVPGVDITPIAEGQNLSDMLEAGGIDALYTARVPRHFTDGTRRVRRLWADPAAAEKEYFERTGIFPIMHTVVLRRDVYERNRWLARALTDAFQEAKERADRALGATVALAATAAAGRPKRRLGHASSSAPTWRSGRAPRPRLPDGLPALPARAGAHRTAAGPRGTVRPETHESFVVSWAARERRI